MTSGAGIEGAASLMFPDPADQTSVQCPVDWPMPAQQHRGIFRTRYIAGPVQLRSLFAEDRIATEVRPKHERTTTEARANHHRSTSEPPPKHQRTITEHAPNHHRTCTEPPPKHQRTITEHA